MLEIFITVVAAVVAGGIILKFWRQILVFILSLVIIAISLVICIPLYICRFIANLFLGCFSNETLEEKITQTYDVMLHVASKPQELAKGQQTIRRLLTILKKREEKKNDKYVEDMLEEAKWVL